MQTLLPSLTFSPKIRATFSPTFGVVINTNR